RVAGHFRRYGKLDRPVRFISLQARRHVARDGREIDWRAMHLRAAHTRQWQQAIDELRHALGGLAHIAKPGLSFRRKTVRAILDQGLTEPVDAAQRRPEVV